jgi:hypothetical protein
MSLHTRRREAGRPSSVPLLVAAVTLLLFTPVSSQVATQPTEATVRIIVVETADEARLVTETNRGAVGARITVTVPAEGAAWGWR